MPESPTPPTANRSSLLSAREAPRPGTSPGRPRCAALARGRQPQLLGLRLRALERRAAPSRDLLPPRPQDLRRPGNPAARRVSLTPISTSSLASASGSARYRAMPLDRPSLPRSILGRWRLPASSSGCGSRLNLRPASSGSGPLIRRRSTAGCSATHTSTCNRPPAHLIVLPVEAPCVASAPAPRWPLGCGLSRLRHRAPGYMIAPRQSIIEGRERRHG